MANIASAKKRARKIVRRTKVRSDYKSKVRTLVVNTEKLIAAGDFQAASQALCKCESSFAKAAQRNYFKKGTFSRKISRLTKSLSKIAT